MPTDRADEFTTKLLTTLDPAAMGLLFQPLRQQQLAAAGGTQAATMINHELTAELAMAGAI